MTDSEYILSWIEKAEQDITTVNQLVERPDQEWVASSICYHCQQAVEKVLKAFLIKNQIEPEKTHNLEFLLEKCILINPEFPAFDFKNLTYYAVEARYPDDYINPDLDEVKYYIESSKEIVNEIKKMIP